MTISRQKPGSRTGKEERSFHVGLLENRRQRRRRPLTEVRSATDVQCTQDHASASSKREKSENEIIIKKTVRETDFLFCELVVTRRTGGKQ